MQLKNMAVQVLLKKRTVNKEIMKVFKGKPKSSLTTAGGG